MSATKHTPGPWEADTLNGRIVVCADRTTPKGTKVNHVILDCDYENGIPYEEALANAKFIADAPETAAERDRLKGVLFQRDIEIETLKHNARIHLTSAVELQQQAAIYKVINAKLLEALKEIVTEYGGAENFKNAQAAIAEAEGKS